MRVEHSTTEVESTGDIQKIKGGVSVRKTSKLVDFLSNSLYSDPHGSLVRELTANCYDAYIALEKERGIKSEEAVIVKYTEEEHQGFISFIDFGIGISPEKLETIYLQILESDKEDEDNSIGGFGIGAKSFLAYTDSVQLITRYDGFEYLYIVGKDENGEFGAYVMDTKPTIEKNGSEVKISIGTSNFLEKATDYEIFKNKVREQLFYFDNVYVDGFDLDNNWNLFEGQYFKFRTGWTSRFTHMHIVLGKVAYPINWNLLGIDPVEIAVGVKFDIGELRVTISREEIRYTEAAKKLIIERVELAKEELISIYASQTEEVDTLEEYYSKANAKAKYIKFVDNEGKEHRLSLPVKSTWNSTKNIYEYEDSIPNLPVARYKPIAHLPVTLPKDPFFMFEFKGVIAEIFPKKDARIDTLTEKLQKDTFLGVKEYGQSVYRIKTLRTRPIDNYIFWKEKQNNKRPVLLTLKKHLDYDDYVKTLKLGKTRKITITEPDGYTRTKTVAEPILGKAKIIKEFKRIMIKELVSRTQSYEAQKPSPAYLSYLQFQKISKKRIKLEGIISIYNIEASCSDTLDLSKLDRYTGFIIYGNRDQAKEVREIKDLLYSKIERNPRFSSKDLTKSQKFLTTGARNCEQLKGNPYWLSVEEFMSGHNRLFKNSVTAYYVNKALSECTPAHLRSNLPLFNKNLSDRLKVLKSFVDKNLKHTYNLNSDFADSLVKIGLENGLLWNHLIKEADEIKEWFKGLDHLMWIEGSGWTYVEVQKDILTILKSRGKRIGNEHYLVKPEEVVIVSVKGNVQLEIELDEEESEELDEDNSIEDEETIN